MEELNYEMSISEITEQLKKVQHMAFATTENGHVYNRNMSIINDGIDIYFQTDKNFEKIRHIMANPDVALCEGNLQIEAKAEIAGHPLDCEIFRNEYKMKHKQAFERYAALSVNVVVKAVPERIKMWKYLDDEPYIDYVDVINKKAWREKYIAE
jgi:general stress protein 26